MAYITKVTAGGNTEMRVGSSLYGVCNTATGTAAKTVSIDGFDTLVEGVTIHVKFQYYNTASNATLNVNSTGAKPLCARTDARVSNTSSVSWGLGSVVSLTYDGDNWVMNQPELWYGTSGVAGRVKLSDSTSSSTAAANGQTAATPKAVKDALDAAKAYADGLVTGAATFQGSIGADTSTADYTQTTLEASSYKKGWYWVVNAKSTYVGKACGVGDMVYCTSDKDSAYSADDFTVVQNEMDSITNSEIDTILATE